MRERSAKRFALSYCSASCEIGSTEKPLGFLLSAQRGSACACSLTWQLNASSMANGAVYARPSILFVCLVSSVLSAVLVLLVLHTSGSLQSPGNSSLNNIGAIVEREVHMRTTRTVDSSNAAVRRGKKEFRPVAVLAEHSQKRILVTGGAGFVGSHLVDRLMEQGHEGKSLTCTRTAHST
jgi:NAD dependent epimerase/dehydratase family